MIYRNEFDNFTTVFAQLAYEPLRVVIELQPNSQLVNYDLLHFDGLLARAVVTTATRGHLLADATEPYWIPLPLKMLWQSDDSLPLWAASSLLPTGVTAEDVYYRHKRNSGGWLHNKRKLITRNGRFMERRIPTPTLVCERLVARCIGNAEWIGRLLEGFTHIGKLRTARIRHVVIESADFTERDICIDGDTLIKAVPAAANIVPWLHNPQVVGWTPPHWKPSLFALGWPCGTPTSTLTNWFLSIDKL